MTRMIANEFENEFKCFAILEMIDEKQQQHQKQ